MVSCGVMLTPTPPVTHRFVIDTLVLPTLPIQHVSMFTQVSLSYKSLLSDVDSRVLTTAMAPSKF